MSELQTRINKPGDSSQLGMCGVGENYYCSQDVVISVALELVHWILKVMQPNFTITVWGRLGASELYIIKLYKFTPSFSNNP